MSIVFALIIGFIVSSILYLQAKQANEKETIQRQIAEQETIRANDEAKKAQKNAEDIRKSLYFNKIALIQSEYKSANTSNVKQLLQECPEDLCNWEYKYLKKNSDQSIMTLKGHNGLVDEIFFESDNSRVISASQSDKTIRVWEIKTGKELRVLRFDPKTKLIAVSPNGKQAISSEENNIIKLWDIENESLIRTFRGHDHQVSCIQFSSKGSTFASTDSGRDNHNPTIKIWDIHTGKEVQCISYSGNPISSMDLSPNGDRLISKSVGYPYELKLWDTSTGALIQEVSEYYYSHMEVSHFWDVQFDYSGKFILTANWGQAWIWDAESLRIITGVTNAHNYGSRRAIFSPEGKYFLTGGIFGDLRLWQSCNGRLIRTLQGHTSEVWSLAYSPDGTLIASGDSDGTIKIWNVLVGHEVIEVSSTDNYPTNVIALNPEGTLVAFGGTSNNIKVWDLFGFEESCTLTGHEGHILSLDFRPNGKNIVSGSRDSSIRTWDITSDPPITLNVFKGHSNSVNSVRYSPNGKFIISGSSDKTIKVWSIDEGVLIMTLRGHGDDVSSVQYALDGKQIISGSKDKTVRIWDSETGQCLKIFTGHKSGVSCVTLASDGKTIVSGDESGMGIIWNKETGKQITFLKGHLNGLTKFIFSKDNMRIFSGSEDGIIRVWDTETGQCILTLGDYDTGGIRDLAINTEGDTIIAIPSWRPSMMVYGLKYEQIYADRQISKIHLKYNLTLATEELKTNPQKKPLHVKLFNGHHYLLFMEPQNWHDANNYAKSFGGHLATITSKEENDWMINTFPICVVGNYWLGATDEKSEGTWEWVTGEKWDYSNWGPEQPDNYKGLQNGLLYVENKWDDDNMEIKYPFLIEWDN